MFQATSSLPVPVGPLIRMLTSLFAYLSIDSFSCTIGVESPINCFASSSDSMFCISRLSDFTFCFSSLRFSAALKMLRRKSVGW